MARIRAGARKYFPRDAMSGLHGDAREADRLLIELSAGGPNARLAGSGKVGLARGTGIHRNRSVRTGGRTGIAAWTATHPIAPSTTDRNDGYRRYDRQHQQPFHGSNLRERPATKGQAVGRETIPHLP
jgi:hypothetical protein